MVDLGNKYVSSHITLVRVLVKPLMTIRNDYTSLSEAKKSLKSTNLLADGIIAIDTSIGMTYRIKDPTIDLVCRDGSLSYGTTADNVVKLIPSAKDMLEGKIYECALEWNGSYSLSRYSIRSDKVYPNTTKVAEDILSLIKKDESYYPTLLGRVLNNSFAVKSYIYCLAYEMGTRSQLIIDMATGRF